MLEKVPVKASPPPFYADNQVNHLFMAAIQTYPSYLNTLGLDCY